METHIRPHEGVACDLTHGDLKVSPDGHFLVHADGEPFFWLGDTAWELFHRLNREEAEVYLENRRAKGFTVVQAVCLAEYGGLTDPNPYGHLPLVDNDPTQPVEAYFAHVDFVVQAAEAKGIFIGMLPTWGDKVRKNWGQGPEIFTPENAQVYGEFLGQRYRHAPNIVWILGGDRFPDGYEAIWNAMAAGLKSGDAGRHLITYHPQGAGASSTYFHDALWLDFNMIQSGHHQHDIPNYEMVEHDYALSPAKPTLDAEPRYENHPINWKPELGRFDAYDVRQGAYWAVFAGAFGHTYGCHDIWQIFDAGREPVAWADTPWHQAIDFPGAWQMLALQRLMLSRPFLSRIPDQSLLVGGGEPGHDHAQVTRSRDGSYAFVYVPGGKPVTLDTSKLSGERLQTWLFDPRTGTARALEESRNVGLYAFEPPGDPARGNDWVLVIDDADRDFPPPGSA